ncbi:MAG: HAD family hydrolase [Phycisphaerales bacterium]
MTNKPDPTDSSKAPARIAMWSGPRNISTALMRSWGSRPDTAVVDEPLYGHYLRWLPGERRREHPGADETIAAMDGDWKSVTNTLIGPVPGNRPIWYQKHMAHHLTPGIDLSWIDGLTNCFLIRDPAAMIASFAKVIPNPTPDDLGLPAQTALFGRVRQPTGRLPAVIDSADVLRDPPGVLSALCAHIGIPFDDSMLAWPPGPRDTDGPWAPHWYASVEQSTAFAPPHTERPIIPDHLQSVLDTCQPMYDALAQHRITG